MQIWMTLTLALQMVTALVMIGLVLIQHGKGADMGASFGGGSSGSLFGATGSANFLSRSTAACATVFFACTLALAFMSNAGGGLRAGEGGGSVLDRAAPAASAPAPGSIPGSIPGAIPGALPGAIPGPAPAQDSAPPAAAAAPASAPAPAPAIPTR
jgi:preprotein translocase subunit SecG